MRTIHITNEADLIPLPGRSVSAWESGVVRVEEKYVGLTSMESIHRPLFAVGNPPPSGDNTPSFDGLTISSLPNETRRDDGFTEYNVTLHGRVDNTGTGDPTSPEALLQQSSLIYNSGELGSIKYSAFTPRIVTAVINKNVGRALETPRDWDYAVQPFDPDDLNVNFFIKKYNGGRLQLASWYTIPFKSDETTTVIFNKQQITESSLLYNIGVLRMKADADFSKNGSVDELTVNWTLDTLVIVATAALGFTIFDTNSNVIDTPETIFP